VIMVAANANTVSRTGRKILTRTVVVGGPVFKFDLSTIPSDARHCRSNQNE
jgi:hypothetical protein